MVRFFLAFLVVFTMPINAETTSVTVSKVYSLDRASRTDVLSLFKRHSLSKAKQALPSLLYGGESLSDGDYSESLRSYSASVFKYTLVSESLDHENNSIALTAKVTFDKKDALNALQEVKDGIDAQRKAKAFESLSKEIEADKIKDLTELFIKRAESLEKAYSVDELEPGSDAYIVTKRIAQERVLAEAMKDVYLKYLLPAVKAAKANKETHAANSTRADGKPLPRYVFHVSTDVPLVSGAEELIADQEVITWRDELEYVLAPYQERWPFITTALIRSRMRVCAGTATLMDDDTFPGYEAVRPDFHTDTMRRRVGKLYVQDGTRNTLNSKRSMLGICISR